MRTVLPEEEYMARLGLIMKRDFFPLLLEQEALSVEERLSLTEFQSKYTTEDDASFSELFHRENERKRKKFERVYGGPAVLCDDPSKRLLLQPTQQDLSKFKRTEAKLNLILPAAPTQETTINLQNTRFPEDEKLFTSGLRFKIPETPVREQLAHSLSTPKASISHSTPIRGSKAKVKKPPVVYNMNDLKALTPKRKDK